MQFKLIFGQPGPKVIKLFSCSTQLSMINTTYESLKARTICILRHFSLYEQLKFRAQLSWAWKKFYNLGTCTHTSLTAAFVYSFWFMYIWETGHAPGGHVFQQINFSSPISVEGHVVTISATLFWFKRRYCKFHIHWYISEIRLAPWQPCFCMYSQTCCCGHLY